MDGQLTFRAGARAGDAAAIARKSTASLDTSAALADLFHGKDFQEPLKPSTILPAEGNIDPPLAQSPTHYGDNPPVLDAAVTDVPQSSASVAAAEALAATKQERAILIARMSLASDPGYAITKPSSSFGRAGHMVVNILGGFCDAVYVGVNSAGRGCAQAFGVVQDACMSLTRQAISAVYAQDAGVSHGARAGAKPYVPPSSVATEATIAAFVEPMKSALAATSVLDDFKDGNITYQNLLYVLKPKAFRETQDAAGRGLNAAPATESSSLLRRLTTSMNNAQYICEKLQLFMSDPQEIAAARKQYTDYRDARYPDFKDLYERLCPFGNMTEHAMTAMVNRVNAGIKQQQAACQERGEVFDEAAHFLDIALTPDGAPPVSPRQLSADILRMRQCLADLVAYLDGMA